MLGWEYCILEQMTNTASEFTGFLHDLENQVDMLRTLCSWCEAPVQGMLSRDILFLTHVSLSMCPSQFMVDTKL